MITSAALKNGFTGGLIVDYPNSKKAKKFYLFLMAGYSEEIMNEARQVIMPEAKMGEEESEESSEEEDSDEEEDEEEDKESDNEKIDVKGKHRKDFKKKKGFEKRISVGPSGIAKKHKEEYNKVKDRKWIIRKKER